MTENPSPSDAMTAAKVHVNLSDRSYEIAILENAFPQFPEFVQSCLEPHEHLKSAQRKALVVTDSHVRPLYAERVTEELSQAGWGTRLAEVPAGEQSKSLEIASCLYDHLVEMQADRRTLVIAVGGGVIGDLAGFAAATYARGVPFIQVPTTLLADVDSSVGGKVGINHPHGKNLIGAFHQPVGVFIETSTLKSLPDRDYRSGLAEIVKYGVILDADLFARLEQNTSAINQRDPQLLKEIIQRSCQLKADVVQEDEFERTGLRAILNYGHTFAHAYEALCGYGELMHGEAVSIGMIDASRLAEALGMLEPEVTSRQIDLLTQLGLPTELPETVSLTIEDVIGRMKLDKKTVAGQLRFILPHRIGQVEVVKGVPQEQVQQILKHSLS